jgi:flagellin-like protein
MNSKSDSAVSPVIGILLMLVVTIIIAAVVSSFAGGMAKDETKTPQASFSVKSNINSISGTSNYPGDGYTYPGGYTEDKNYIEFQHKGGDTLSLSDIKLQLQSGDTKIILGTDNSPNLDKTTAFSCREDPVNSTYFNKVGDSNKYISTSDKFRLVADGNYGGFGAKYIFYRPEGMQGGLGLEVGSKIDYSIIDKTSGRTITSGEFTV